MNKKVFLSVITIVGTTVLIGTIVSFASQREKISASTTVASPLSEKTIEQEKQLTLMAFGDIMLSRNVAGKMKTNGNDYPFLKVRDTLKTADIVFANLENPITPGPEIKTGQMMFHANPGSEQALKDAGVSIVSLANNHTPNFGANGLTDTVKYLDSIGIEHVGAGKNAQDASKAVFTTTNGLKIAWLAYNSPDVVPKSYAASANHAGTNFMDLERMISAVKEARARADLVIVSMHAGTEYKTSPNKTQKEFAHAAIDTGAEMVIGHHPHVVQTMEEYKGKFIFYSLGNFVFDQMWSRETREGLGLKITLTKDGVQDVSFLPLIIDDYAQPHFVRGKEAEKIIKHLKAPTSKRIVTPIVSESKTEANEWLTIRMIIDTGADYTLLPRSYAQAIGIRLESDCTQFETSGIGGHEIVFVHPRVHVRLGDWEADVPVGFLDRDAVPALLGRHKFLEALSVTFEHHNTIFRSLT